MSSSTPRQSPLNQSWAGEIHDFKNLLEPATQAVFVLCDLELENFGFDLDNDIRNVTQAVADLEKLKNTLGAIHQMSIAEFDKTLKPNEGNYKAIRKAEYEVLLMKALDLATFFSNVLPQVTPNGFDIDPKEYTDITIAAINDAILFLNPSYTQTPTQLGALTAQVAKHHQLTLQRNNNTIVIHFSPADLDQVFAKGSYARFIHSIIENGVTNSNRFTKNDAIQIDVTLGNNKQFFEIKIRDQGEGMPPAYAKKLAAGNREHLSRGGNGVGLHELVTTTKAIGGHLAVKSDMSADHHGTTFLWKLPTQQLLIKQPKQAYPIKIFSFDSIPAAEIPTSSTSKTLGKK